MTVESRDTKRLDARVFTEEPGQLGGTAFRFDLRFSVEILPERAPGKSLGSGGGAPGAAYLAYVTGLREGDAVALIAHDELSAASYLESLEGEELAWQLESFAETAPKAMKVTGGELFEGYAILEVEGRDWSGDRVEGKVKMSEEAGAWRFAEERLKVVF